MCLSVCVCVRKWRSRKSVDDDVVGVVWVRVEMYVFLLKKRRRHVSSYSQTCAFVGVFFGWYRNEYYANEEPQHDFPDDVHVTTEIPPVYKSIQSNESPELSTSFCAYSWWNQPSLAGILITFSERAGLLWRSFMRETRHHTRGKQPVSVYHYRERAVFGKVGVVRSMKIHTFSTVGDFAGDDGPKSRDVAYVNYTCYEY